MWVEEIWKYQRKKERGGGVRHAEDEGKDCMYLQLKQNFDNTFQILNLQPFLKWPR